ncbi:MAG: DUF1385 domain-containing protein [Oscillospiraceae bacterium]|nr:DUF1385 domain-containing protein [Oscillospiraceae bacterium]MBQ4544897.1 DUF1385 domain-containing protein [Oscillospiraceae bacterium]
MMKSCKKTTIGGQALIEGIMMLGPEKSAIAVRRADGEIELKVDEQKKLTERYKILSWPFLRGIAGLFESLKRGFAALEYSSSIAIEEIEEEPTRFEKWLEKKFGSRAVESAVMGIATVLGIAIPIVLFIFLPTLLAGTLDKYIGSGLGRNLLEGLLRIVVFLIFMFSVSRMKDMKRVFSYHGAEHKTIFCYEAGEELTVENVKKFSKEHPRCGTSFMFSVMIISVLVFSVVSWSNPFVRMGLRLLLLPVVVGISYEVNRYIGRHDNFLTKIIRTPGLWFQKFTTFEPDDGMIEIAITALREVIPEDSEKDNW